MSRTLVISSLFLIAVAASPDAAEAAAAAGAPGSACGVVTDQRAAPPRNDDIFPVVITRIDGESTPLEPRNRHSVQPGKRILTVDERIDRHRLPGAAVAQIERMRTLEQQRAYKTFEVDVEAGTSYAIGARLRRDRLDAESIRTNQHWEPVVWDTRPERCP